MRIRLLSALAGITACLLGGTAATQAAAGPLLVPMHTDTVVAFIPEEELARSTEDVRDESSAQYLQLTPAVIYYVLPEGYVPPEPLVSEVSLYRLRAYQWESADGYSSKCTLDGNSCFGMGCASQAKFDTWRWHSASPFAASCIKFFGISYTVPMI